MAEATYPGAKLNNPLIKERVLKNCSHQVYLDQPKQLLDGMMEDFDKIPEIISISKQKNIEKLVTSVFPRF